MDPFSFGAWVHTHTPHSATALYEAAAASAIFFLVGVYLTCLISGSARYLEDKWVIQTAAAAAPIPTYLLMLVVPFDPDLANTVLDDRIVVALAALYGVVETLKDIKEIAARAQGRRAARSRQNSD